VDFGTGALGDMGCYSFDTFFRVLKLGPVSRVQASSTKVHAETFPQATVVHFDFAARKSIPPVRLTWYDGGLKPPRPPELPPDTVLDKDGLFFVGDGGTILCGFGAPAPGANFEFAGMVTETLHIGNVAVRAEKELEWDAAAQRIANAADANALLRSSYREGW
jgi:hypothetical protein